MHDMLIQLKLFGGLDSYIPTKQNPYPTETSEGSTIGDVLDHVGVPREKPRIIFVNSRHAHLDHVLRDGDVLAVFPPVAGG
jgi:molybdopterin converting factor small subunit